VSPLLVTVSTAADCPGVITSVVGLTWMSPAAAVKLAIIAANATTKRLSMTSSECTAQRRRDG
jgi:hypothetical protein